MRHLGTDVKVGAFVVAGLGTLVFMVFVLSPEWFSRTRRNPYYTLVDNAAGIVPKTHVLTNGVVIGQVAAVGLTGHQTRLDLSLDAEVAVPQGSQVVIREKGLLGDVFIDIVRAPGSNPLLPPGALIPADNNHVGLSQLISLAGSVGQDLKQVSEAISDALALQGGESNIAAIVANVRDFFGEAKSMVLENRENVASLIADLKVTSASLKSVVAERERQLGAIIDHVSGAAADVRAISKNIRERVTGENGEKLDQMIARLERTMVSIEETAADARTIARRIEQGQGTLGKLVNEDDALKEIQGAVADIREVLAPATQLKVNVDYHGELRQDNVTQHYFRAHLRTRPDKFFVLGANSSGEQIRETTTTTIASPAPDGTELVPPEPVTIRERIVERGPILFDAQYGKRWGSLQLRLGLFESTGGLGADLLAWDDQLKLSVEAFDWSSTSPYRHTARIRAFSSLVLFKHLYGMAGVDDLTRREPATGERAALNYFVGAGLSFTDDDIKAVIGTAALAR